MGVSGRLYFAIYEGKKSEVMVAHTEEAGFLLRVLNF
jgi:hypothetical protein